MCDINPGSNLESTWREDIWNDNVEMSAGRLFFIFKMSLNSVIEIADFRIDLITSDILILLLKHNYEKQSPYI